MKIAAIEIDNEEQLKALKAFVKAMRMKFIGLTDQNLNLEKKEILQGIALGYKESLSIEKGEIKPKTIEQLLDEL